jgi:hypothetical protein
LFAVVVDERLFNPKTIAATTMIAAMNAAAIAPPVMPVPGAGA